jgi:hypothetical protein
VGGSALDPGRIVGSDGAAAAHAWRSPTPVEVPVDGAAEAVGFDWTWWGGDRAAGIGADASSSTTVRIESVVVTASDAVRRDAPAGLRTALLAGVGDPVAAVAGVRVDAMQGAVVGRAADGLDVAASPLVGIRADIPLGRGVSLDAAIDAEPVGGAMGGRAALRLPLDEAWRLELGAAVGTDGDWPNPGARTVHGRTADAPRVAIWIGLRAEF